MSAAEPDASAVVAEPATTAVETLSAASCRNCGAQLTGPFCSQCGQRVEHEDHSVWHFAREVAEDLTHADSRLWRTMSPLLFRPGFLTREFLDGRRARYLPPLRLYLVISLVFFVLASFRSHSGVIVTISSDGGMPNSITTTPLPKDGKGATAEQLQRACSDVGVDPSLDPKWSRRLQKSCREMIADGDRSRYERLLHNIPRALFIFLPLLAASMKLLYWRPRRYYMEHLLFCIHNHAFIFLFFALYLIASRLIPLTGLRNALFAASLLYVFVYLYRAMKYVYGQGRARTLAKLAVLSFWYVVCGGLMLGLVFVYDALRA
jgi:hypothetical protein